MARMRMLGPCGRRRGDGGLFGAAGEPVGGIFDVAAGDDSAVGEQERGADAEVAVRCVGVCGGGLREISQPLLFGI